VFVVDKNIVKREKIIWVDNLKGLAIIAVVIGHIASPVSNFIYAWHIPLFFFVSGLLINGDRSIKESFKKDFKRLIIPFIIFSIVGLIAEYIKRWIFPGFPFINGNIDLRNELIGIFWWMDYSHLHQYGFVLWFLPALFWAKNILLFFKKTLKNQYLISILSLAILLLFSNQSWILPFGIDKAFLGIFWLSIAWLITGRFWLLSLVALLFLPIPETNIALKIVSWYGLCYSIVVINTLVGMIKLIPKSVKLLATFGQETMFLLIIHPYIDNLAFFLVICLLKGNWLLEILCVLTTLGVLVINIESVKMVTKYIFQNNNLFMVPFKLINAFSVIHFQLISKKEIVKKIDNCRKIILFPSCVASRMFLYTDIPDKEEISLLRENLNRESIFLDIGANVGSYSVLLSDRTKKIYAFEPSPLSNIRCRKNFKLNGIGENNVKNIALSDKVGVSGFTDFGGTSTINHISENLEGKIKVKTESLDNWVIKNIKVSHFNLVMKIDVEGNEEKVIIGAHKLFKNKRIKYIVLEVLDKNSKVFDLINSYGYTTGLISGNNYYVKKN